MTEKEIKTINKTIDGIETRLDSIEDLLWWTILAEQRGFKIGQRVKFSERAIRKGFGSRTKGGVTKGKIVEIGDTFSIKVLLDGYKHPQSYHHSLFDAN